MVGPLLEVEVAKICTMPGRESNLEVKIVKESMVGALLEVEVAKICTMPARESDLEGVGALLEVEVAKICTTPARENDLEVKIVKAPGARDVFGGSNCVLCGKRRDFGTASS